MQNQCDIEPQQAAEARVLRQCDRTIADISLDHQRPMCIIV